MKGEKDFRPDTHIHPYQEGFEDSTRFSTIPHSYEDLIGMPLKEGAINEMEVILRLGATDNKDKITKNIEVFQLEEMHTAHSDYVRSLIRLCVISNHQHLQNLAVAYDGLFDGVEELYQLAFGKHLRSKEYSKEALSKLTHDILQNSDLNSLH